LFHWIVQLNEVWRHAKHISAGIALVVGLGFPGYIQAADKDDDENESEASRANFRTCCGALEVKSP